MMSLIGKVYAMRQTCQARFADTALRSPLIAEGMHKARRRLCVLFIKINGHCCRHNFE